MAGSVYRRVLGETPEAGSLNFLRNLGWIGVCFAIAKVISSLVNIYAGRILGPAEYGKINLFVSAGAFISPFLTIGLANSIVKYGAPESDREQVFSTAGAAFASLTALVLSAAFLFRGPISSFLGITTGMLMISSAYAACTGAFTLAAAMQQAAGNFSGRGIGEIAFSVILAATFTAGALVYPRRYEVMAVAYICAFAGVAIFWSWRSAAGIKLSFLSGDQFSRMFRYSLFSFLGGLASFLVFNVQGLILNAFLTPKEVGIFAAYYSATFGVAGYLGYAIGTVLFPKAAGSTNRRRLWFMAAKGWLRLSPAAFILFLAAETAILFLMGRVQYGMDLGLMCLFALCGTLLMAQSSLAQIMLSGGVKASKLSLLMVWTAGALNFTLCLVLAPAIGVAGAAAAFIATYALSIYWLWRARDSYLD